MHRVHRSFPSLVTFFVVGAPHEEGASGKNNKDDFRRPVPILGVALAILPQPVELLAEDVPDADLLPAQPHHQRQNGHHDAAGEDYDALAFLALVHGVIVARRRGRR